MQPYLFPYIGIYQLIAAVDEFVVLDDAAFMKRSYLQRNTVLLAGRAHQFCAPVLEASQNRSINAHRFAGDWRALVRLLRSAYQDAPMAADVLPLIERVLLDGDENVARKNTSSLRAVCEYLGVERRWTFASTIVSVNGLRGQQRIIELCGRAGATMYVNPPGGRALYEAAGFAAAGITLRFLEPRQAPYEQRNAGFVPNLSIIDLLMNLPREAVRARLDDHALAP